MILKFIEMFEPIDIVDLNKDIIPISPKKNLGLKIAVTIGSVLLFLFVCAKIYSAEKKSPEENN
jgi:hypothetical protein